MTSNLYFNVRTEMEATEHVNFFTWVSTRATESFECLIESLCIIEI